MPTADLLEEPARRLSALFLKIKLGDFVKVVAFLLMLAFIFTLKTIDRVFGTGGVIVIALLLASGFIFLFVKSTKDRENKIRSKYSEEVAEKILAGKFWIGQSKNELRDSIGLPEKIETQQNSKNSKEIWKFFHKESNRIRLKITMTDGVVTQIDRK
ncbi:hypothetical protein [Burkholderia multivorans]|uniref:hypothetical protein n=1 Tax=Burkholderia multivorans TaxID=87883 RepID=UPI0021C1F0E3|nr:hypothetical protein [Burkholderia multivorans]